MSVAAILLAAGLGTRFGTQPKGLARFAGTPLLRRAAEAALASRADPVLVVLGHEADALAATIEDLPVAILRCPDYARGLSRSLQTGFAALPDGVDAAVVCLADMPLVGADILDALVAAWAETPDVAAIALVHGGRRGNPVLLSRALAPAIAALDGDTGAGPLLRARRDVREIPWGDDRIHLDVDTPDALRAMEARA